MVWMAADLAGHQGKFRDYALLGDDIVIANEVVALQYARMVKEFGVDISESKSIISDSGSFEFAKRVREGSVDFSLRMNGRGSS